MFERTDELTPVHATRVCESAADCDGVPCHADVPGAFGFCEVHGDVAEGGGCANSFDCAAGLECERENGASFCASDD